MRESKTDLTRGVTQDMRTGDLVMISEKYLSDGWMRLWSSKNPGESPPGYKPNSPDKLWVHEIALVLEVSTDILHLVRVLSPRGIEGWIAQGNLEIIQSIE